MRLKQNLIKLLKKSTAGRLSNALCCDTLNRGLMDMCEHCPLSSEENYEEAIQQLEEE